MRILIACDGSDCAMAAIEDLAHAGLPPEALAKVLVVADTWPHLPASLYVHQDAQVVSQLSLASQRAHILAEEALLEAGRFCRAAADRVRAMYPRWQVQTTVVGGSPSRTIVEDAEHWPADLVVVGSHGRSAMGRMFFGSVSQKVVAYCPCTVRIGRGRPDRGQGAPRLLVGFDASQASQKVVTAIAQRHWPAGTQAWLVTAVDVRLSATFPTLGEVDPLKPLEQQGQAAARRLAQAGIEAVSELRDGYPNHVLLQEAIARDADCVFVGARGQSRLERFLLGTVSAAVVTRAHCSVEIIR